MERTRTGRAVAAWVALAVAVAACRPGTAGDLSDVPAGIQDRDRSPHLLPASAERDRAFEPREHVEYWPPPNPVWQPKPCPDLYSDELQTFELEIAPEVWEEIEYEFKNFSELYKSGIDLETYRPVQRFTHAGKSTTDVMIRLRGNTDFWDHQEKMQLQISFNETNPNGRFRGQRKIVLDSAHYNPTYLYDRLAASIARDAGVIATCANHARVYLNGEFLGLYGNIEKIDREFLERNFEDPSANLYKMSKKTPGELKTNEDENPDTSRYHEFWNADRITELDALANIPQMVRAWAVEAVFPNTDGYWAGGWNFYLYDEPGKGFAYLLWDLDRAFDGRYDLDPINWHKTNANFNGRPHVELILGDPKWRWEFIRELRHIRNSMDVNELQARIDRWADQIRDSAREDWRAPWTFEEHEQAVAQLRAHVGKRLQFLDRWLACWEAHQGEENFHGPCPQ